MFSDDDSGRKYHKLLKYRDSISDAIHTYKQLSEVRNSAIRHVRAQPSEETWDLLLEALNRERAYLKLFGKKGQEIYETLRPLVEQLLRKAKSEEETLFTQNAARLVGIIELFLDYQAKTDVGVRKTIAEIERTHSLHTVSELVTLRQELVEKIQHERSAFERSFDSLFGPRAFVTLGVVPTIESFFILIATRSLHLDQTFASEAYYIPLFAIPFLAATDLLCREMRETKMVYDQLGLARL